MTAADDLVDAFRTAVRALAPLGDGKAGFDGATELAELLRGLAVEAADMRAAIVGRLYASGGGSYPQLSELLGISQIRVRQLIKAAAGGPKGKPKARPVVVEVPVVVVPEPRPVVPVSAPLPPPVVPVQPAVVAKVADEQRPRRTRSKAAPVDFSSPDWRDAVRAAAVPRETDGS